MLAMLLALALALAAPQSFAEQVVSGEVAAASLPREAAQTLRLIRARGPFPYRQDGVVFSNREHRLPAQPRNYYHEYTVPTPGAHDRGARRIIAGGNGEVYYTDDHYRSFRLIRQ
jgi:ribonuclease T1